MRDIVMPIVHPIENGKRLGYIEIEEVKGREGPGPIEEAISQRCQRKDRRTIGSNDEQKA